jgi:hypothetical protein
MSTHALKPFEATDPSRTFPRFKTAGLVTPAEPPAAPAEQDIREVLAMVDAYLAEEACRIEHERNQPPARTFGEWAGALLAQLVVGWRAVREFVDAVSEVKVREGMRECARRCENTRPELAAALRRTADKTWIVD